MSEYTKLLEAVANVAKEHALHVDAGHYPTATIDSLRETGLLGLIASTDVGGMGLGPRAAATVVERLARECGTSAMVTCMH
jgi:alkylation response protein AidB-like acyl-CoA dehydrogenase